jgi:serine/threonine-protein kinase RsbW
MKDQVLIEINNDLQELRRVNEIAEEFGEKMKLSAVSMYNIHLVLEEILTNIISYAYEDEEVHQIEVQISMKNDLVDIIISDDGREFDPTSVEDPLLSDDLESRKIGGLGVFLVKKTMRTVDYNRLQNKNILHIQSNR